MADKTYKTEDEIKKAFNTTHLVKRENIIQVQHYATGKFHYLVENCYGWVETGMTSENSQFFMNWFRIGV